MPTDTGISVSGIAVPKPQLPGGHGPVSVESYDAHRFVCQAGDTDYAAVSGKVYGDPKYAQALQAFNGSDGLRLQPNAEIIYPPKEVLEKRYPNFFASNPAPTVPPAASLNPVPSSVYQNQGSGSPVPPATASMGGWGAPPPVTAAPRPTPPIQPLAPVPAVQPHACRASDSSSRREQRSL